MQYVSTDGISPDLLKVNFGAPQQSVLGPLLFLLYINDLYNSIRFSSPYHLADDTGLLNIQDSIGAINKTLNKDLRELSFWLSVEQIALNEARTEIILFKTSNKTMMQTLKLTYTKKRFKHPRMLNTSAFLSMKTWIVKLI